MLGVSPAEGDANGGNLVTVTGSGFLGLSDNATVRGAAIRCRFGAVVQPQPATILNDTAVGCRTTWGAEGGAGEVVSVALNGVDFAPSGVRYNFVGLHRPALLEAFFTQAGRAAAAPTTPPPPPLTVPPFSSGSVL